MSIPYMAVTQWPSVAGVHYFASYRSWPITFMIHHQVAIHIRENFSCCSTVTIVHI